MKLKIGTKSSRSSDSIDCFSFCTSKFANTSKFAISGQNLTFTIMYIYIYIPQKHQYQRISFDKFKTELLVS